MNFTLSAPIKMSLSSLVFPVLRWLILVTKKCFLTLFRSVSSCGSCLGEPCTHSSMSEPCRGQLPSASYQKAYPMVICIGSKASITYKTIHIIHLTLKQYLEPLNIYFGMIILKNIIYFPPVDSQSFNRSNS